MAYTKTNWSDRVVQNPLTYTLQNNPDGTVTLIPAEGTVVQSGTPLTASALNNLEKQYEESVNYINADPVWTPLSLKNGFTISAGRPLKVAKHGNVVHVTGEIGTLTVGAVAASYFSLLPVGYRPLQTEIFAVAHNTVASAFAKVVIDANGNMQLVQADDTTKSVAVTLTFIAG
jgi:hypothetical protein